MTWRSHYYWQEHPHTVWWTVFWRSHISLASLFKHHTCCEEFAPDVWKPWSCISHLEKQSCRGSAKTNSSPMCTWLAPSPTASAAGIWWTPCIPSEMHTYLCLKLGRSASSSWQRIQHLLRLGPSSFLQTSCCRLTKQLSFPWLSPSQFLSLGSWWNSPSPVQGKEVMAWQSSRNGSTSVATEMKHWSFAFSKGSPSNHIMSLKDWQVGSVMVLFLAAEHNATR